MNTDSVKMRSNLPKRVTRTSLLVGGFFFFFLSGVDMGVALSFGLGAALGVYSFEVFRMAVRVFMRTEDMKSEAPIPSWKKWMVSVLLLMKLPLWVGTIYTAILDPHLPILLFVAGLTTPQFVLASKAVSKVLVPGTTSGEQDESSQYVSINTQSREANVS